MRADPVKSHEQRPSPLRALPFKATKGLRHDIVIEYEGLTPDGKHRLPMTIVVVEGDMCSIGRPILQMLTLYRDLEASVDGLKAERDQHITRIKELEGELATANGRIADLRGRNHVQKTAAAKEKSGA